MSGQIYLNRVADILSSIRMTQMPAITRAAEVMAHSIHSGGRVYLFGSGHSVIPVLDIFPRYGSFVGFYPIYDPRLMWFNIVGPGGARELLWLERQEGYARIILESYQLEPRDSMVVFSHGGLNAAPVEMAMEAKNKGLTVISITSLQNHRRAAATHSTGKKLADFSDITIDNCVPPEDALVDIEGVPEKFAAGSTVAAVSIAMALVAEVASQLVKTGHKPMTFVSPNVGSVGQNERVFEAYARSLLSRSC